MSLDVLSVGCSEQVHFTGNHFVASLNLLRILQWMSRLGQPFKSSLVFSCFYGIMVNFRKLKTEMLNTLKIFLANKKSPSDRIFDDKD